VKLLPCIESFAYSNDEVPAKRLPPSFAMKLMRTPPVERLASTADVSNNISLTPAGFGIVPPPQPPPIIVLSEMPFIVKRWSCVLPP
jgi:hypothetical protein